MSEVVYRLRVLGRGRVVVLHRDRLSPYRPLAPVAAGEGGGTSRGSPGGSPAPGGATPRRIQRLTRCRRAPELSRDYVSGDGVVRTTDPSGGSCVLTSAVDAYLGPVQRSMELALWVALCSMQKVCVQIKATLVVEWSVGRQSCVTA